MKTRMHMPVLPPALLNWFDLPVLRPVCLTCLACLAPSLPLTTMLMLQTTPKMVVIVVVLVFNCDGSDRLVMIILRGRVTGAAADGARSLHYSLVFGVSCFLLYSFSLMPMLVGMLPILLQEVLQIALSLNIVYDQ